MDIGAYICALPPYLAAPGAFQGRAVLEVCDPATVRHILQTALPPWRTRVARGGALTCPGAPSRRPCGPEVVVACGDARLFLASACQALARAPWRVDNTSGAAPALDAPKAFDVVDGAQPRLRLHARDGPAEVKLGVVARSERRLLVAVHAGHTYVGIALDATPALEDEATGAEIAPDVPGLALADALIFLVRGLRPHTAWATGIIAEGDELRLCAVIRNPFPAMEGIGGAVRARRGRLLPSADAAPASAVGAAGASSPADAKRPHTQ